VFVAWEGGDLPSAELIDCPACGYEHRAVTAEMALESKLIDREEFDFLSSPVELEGDGPGNETLRVKKK
jgi:hypothetical protein